jgi:hypothetical protein
MSYAGNFNLKSEYSSGFTSGRTQNQYGFSQNQNINSLICGSATFNTLTANSLTAGTLSFQTENVNSLICGSATFITAQCGSLIINNNVNGFPSIFFTGGNEVNGVILRVQIPAPGPQINTVNLSPSDGSNILTDGSNTYTITGNWTFQGGGLTVNEFFRVNGTGIFTNIIANSGTFNTTFSDNYLNRASTGLITSSGTSINIGNAGTTQTIIGGVRGTTTGQNNAIAVLIDSNGQLGTVSSSVRYKDNIKDMNKSKDLNVLISKLRPVTFNYKDEKSSERTSDKQISDGRPKRVGLIAEEVEKVYPDLVAYESDGKTPHSVKYLDLIPIFVHELQLSKKETDILKEEIKLLKREFELLKKK